MGPAPQTAGHGVRRFAIAEGQGRAALDRSERYTSVLRKSVRTTTENGFFHNSVIRPGAALEQTAAHAPSCHRGKMREK